MGSLSCDGAKAFLKEVVKGDMHRFTIVTAERELKLRVAGPEYRAWDFALQPLVGQMGRSASESVMDDDE